MSGTLRKAAVATTSLLALTVSACSSDGDQAGTEAEKYVKVCVSDGNYFAEVTESEAEKNTDLYSEYKQPCRDANKKAAVQRKQQAKEDRTKRRREVVNTTNTVQAAVADAPRRAGKLLGIINLACRDDGIWQHHVFTVYRRMYARYWYPSQAAAFPFELQGALRKACPSKADLKAPYEYGGG